MSDKKKSSKNTVFYGVQDPAIAKAIFALMLVCVVFVFALSIVFLVFTTSANNHYGLIYIDGKYYTSLTDMTSGVERNQGAVFQEQKEYNVGDRVGFLFVKNGNWAVTSYTVDHITDGRYYLDMDGEIAPIYMDVIIGKYVKSIDSPFILSIIGDTTILILIDAVFMVLTVIFGLLYFLVSPRGAKKFDKNKEEKESAPVVAISNDNAALLMSYISTDDNIRPLEDENEALAGLTNTNYYNSVRLHEGEVYTVVKKYPAAARAMEEYGASDMDIIKMNMIGNAEFDNLILMPHKEKTMSMQEIIDFVAGLEGVYCIKKRGTLNWVYKYRSKTILIVKENDDHSGFKVAVKVYPDAAEKLNIIYKALEDSTFPIGPFWYMFNNLRNLPGNVIQWLITESYKISQWQQVRADILRDTPSIESLGYDVLALRTAILSGTRIIPQDKFTIITQTPDGKNNYETVLETGFAGLNVDEFTKELTVQIPEKSLSFSILTKKNASESMLNSICNEITLLYMQENTSVRSDDDQPLAPKVIKRNVRKKSK